MGTTRMHQDPKKGVVDPQCRVHGIANLYMAGSSVFPTCGFSNPTFTLVALALRLADHLSDALQAARR
jgi:choline dehydrogenase-like flavoprotein